MGKDVHNGRQTGSLSVAANDSCMKPLGISFDLDNTLFDRRKTLRAFAAKLMAEFSGELLELSDDAVFLAVADADGDGYTPRAQAIADLCRASLWRIPPQTDYLWEFWKTSFPVCVVAYDDTRSTLEALRNRGVKLGLVSNGWSSLQRQKLRTLGIEDFFDAILIGEEIGVEKPGVAIFKQISRALMIDANCIWHVGDDPVNDVLASHRAGLQAVWFSSNRKWPLACFHPGMTIEALAEVVSLLGGN